MSEPTYVDKVPSYIKESIDRWVENACPTGDCLKAILCNDLSGAFSRADENVIAGMRYILMYLYNECPGPCWGSKKLVDAWKGLNPIQTEEDTP